MMSSDLHVIAVFFNFHHRKNPVLNFRQFAAHMRELGVTLHVGELVLGATPFQVTSDKDPHHLQLRTDSEFFQKENLANLVFKNACRLYPSAEYFGLFDADVEFFNRNVALDTIAQLNRHKVVSAWAQAINLGPDGLPQVYPTPHGATVANSFGYSFLHEHESTSVSKRYGIDWHPGYAWGYRRETWEKLGGLYENCIVGSADVMMAWAMIGKAGWGLPANVTPAFRADADAWCKNAAAVVLADVGYVGGLIHHHWHGRRADRRYVERWAALIDAKFDPALDLTRDFHGLLHLTDRNPKLRFDMRAYLRERNDDANTL